MSSKTSDIKIPFNKPSLFPECVTAIQNAFDEGKVSGDGINSKLCTNFFSERFGYERCLLTPSCTSALEMAALVLNLGPGDEVICPSFTFVSTANAFALRGVTLVFADSETDTPNVSVEEIIQKITARTKAIVVVHYAGVPVDVSRLKEKGIPIVEDCAHAIGSCHPVTQDPVGKDGCLSTFSYHETKNISVGEGGMLVVNDIGLWEKARICREKGTNRAAFCEGRENFYTWLSLGSSYLLSDVDAGVLWGCLQHFDEIQEKRKAIWDFYNDNLWGSSFYKKPCKKKSKANAHMYYLVFNEGNTRKEFEAFMMNHNILVTSHYKPLDASPFVLHAHNDGQQHKTCLNAESWSNRLVRLPMFFELSTEQQEEVVKTINLFCEQLNGLILVPASKKYFEAIRLLRNEHRFSFANSDIIEEDTHAVFMANHFQTYYVAISTGNKVVGFIGHVDGDVRLATDGSSMRKGIGKFMWETFSRQHPEVYIRVKRNNESSRKFFESVGWISEGSEANASVTDLLHLVRKTN